jgi:SAM-dependent methyltransferase
MIDHSSQIVALYERHAVRWDAARGSQPLVEVAWLDRFHESLPARASVLDLGCGGGEPVAAYLVRRGLEVTGVDSSETMVSLFRSRLPGAPAYHCDMRTLHLERRFQGVIAWDSFFHLAHDDQRRMFETFRRHSAPRASLMFTSGPEHGEAIGELEGEPLYHASLSAAEYLALLSDHGYAVLGHVANDPECGGRTVWLARQTS